MSEFKIGDRVEVISEPLDGKNLFGEMGKVVASIDAVDGISRTSDLIGVEFDNKILGHDCCSCGKDGHCWWVVRTCLKKVEDISEETAEDTEGETKEEVKEETKEETMEQKILKALREEIGVDVGEEFDVYEEDEKVGTYKFGENNFFCKVDDEIYRYGGWEDIVCNLSVYTFKRKAFMPKHGEEYFYLNVEESDGESAPADVKVATCTTWTGDIRDYGMLALGNVFRSEEEAFANRERLLEKLEKLRKGE